jgi:low affinity Fe/Cu permease
MPTDAFNNFAKHCAAIVGSPIAFVLSVVIVMTWMVTGPHFAYSDTWQLMINTGTTIVTFLMVFLIQNTQNRDAKVVHQKLNELIRGVHGARNSLINLETLSDQELEVLQQQFERLREKGDTQSPTRRTPKEHG